MGWRIPVCLAALVSGCGGGDGALSVAGDWYRAVADGDEAGACELMEPTGTRAVRAKYTRLPPSAPCERVVGEYVRMLDRRKADAILDGGFEAGEPTPTGEVGVFPATEPYDLQILLMREVAGRWRVISVNISPS